MKKNKDRMIASEVAEACNESVQSVCYQLKKMSKTSLFTIEENKVTKQTYYYINNFFLEKKYIDSARESLDAFIQFFIDMFLIPQEMTEKQLESDIIEFINVIAWLFAMDTKNSF